MSKQFKISKDQLDYLVNNGLVNLDELEVKDTTPWWVIALKVAAYLIGLLLAGYGTASAATVINSLI